MVHTNFEGVRSPYTSPKAVLKTPSTRCEACKKNFDTISQKVRHICEAKT